MPGTRTDYGQMFDHELNIVKGWVGDRGQVLEVPLPISEANTNKILAGSVVNIGTGNVFRLGVNEAIQTTSRGSVPCISFKNEDDFDVNSDLGNASGGVIMALCCLGDFEMQSTEFDDQGDYYPGTYLTSDHDSNSGTNTATGVLKPGVISTDTLVGIISVRGTNSNGSHPTEFGTSFIQFFTWFLPATVAAG